MYVPGLICLVFCKIKRIYLVFYKHVLEVGGESIANNIAEYTTLFWQHAVGFADCSLTPSDVMESSIKSPYLNQTSNLTVATRKQT